MPDTEFLAGLLNLEGRVALVTGARQGIGEGIAIGLARAGADVVVTSRQTVAAVATAATIRGLGRRALEVQLDVTDAASCAAAVDATVSGLGRLDILVNNAGLAVRGEVLDYAEESWDSVLDSNLKGAFLMCRAAGPALVAAGEGRIINLSSTFGHRPYRGRAAYGAAKAGIEQFTRTLALELAGVGILVNAVAPTTVLTESRAALFRKPEELARRTAEIPLGRMATVGDVVAATLFLAGAGSAFITGQTVVVDGGFTLG